MTAPSLDDLQTDLENLRLRKSINELQTLTLHECMELKSQVESELSKMFDLLKANGADMNTELVTKDGFPRGDIDVLQVRLIRRNINMLRNDLASTIRRLESLMATEFETMRRAPVSRPPTDAEFYTIPFANITEVVPNSPAEKAGLVVNDKVCLFGSVHAGNNNNLRALAGLVQQSVNKPLRLKVTRGEESHVLSLIPTAGWGGAGLLGCRLVPL